MRQISEELSPREWAQYNNEKEMLELQMSHAKEMKNLELEVMKLEAKWSSWMKIPLTIVKLPVYILFSLAYCISMITKRDVGEDFWRFMK